MTQVDKGFIEKLKGLNDEITISQVVKLFLRHGKTFTKTMIQNYVRVGVLPQPSGKRYYTRNHLLLLYMIDDLKNLYSLDEIKTIFSPVLSNFENSDLTVVFNCYALFFENSVEELKSTQKDITAQAAALTSSAEMRAFLLKLSMLASSLAAKRMAVEQRDI